MWIELLAMESKPMNKQQIAQEIADATGMGAKWIVDQLDATDNWEAADELLKMGGVDEIRELLQPSNKAG